MRHLAAGSDGRVLGLDEGADLAIDSEVAAWPQVGKRADGCSSTNNREGRVGALYCRALADLTVHECRIRSDRCATRYHRRTLDLRSRQQLDILGEGDPRVDPGARRVVHGDAGKLPTANDELIHAAGCLGQLHSVVDTAQHPAIAHWQGGDRCTARAQQPDDIGEVFLPLLVVQADALQLFA